MSHRNPLSKLFWAHNLSDIILGGQDGLVNVLGVALGVAVASHDTRLILAASLAATFAESVSMAAVAYTSKKTEQDYRTRRHQDNGVQGELEHDEDPVWSSLVVGLAALVGSFVPLLPFFFLPVRPAGLGVQPAIITSVLFSAAVLFLVGAYKAHVTIGHPVRSGLEIMIIGMVAAAAGYAVGYFFQV